MDTVSQKSAHAQSLCTRHTPNLIPFVGKVVVPRSRAGALTIHCINVTY